MFAVRFLALAFLVAFGFSMGQTRPDELNAFGKLVSMSFFLTAPALYFLPTLEAWQREHRNIGAIAAVNAFLGWSIVGWVVALAWALRRPGQAAPATDSPQQEHAVPMRETKTCPFCAEEIMSAAIKCKHCGSDLLS